MCLCIYVTSTGSVAYLGCSDLQWNGTRVWTQMSTGSQTQYSFHFIGVKQVQEREIKNSITPFYETTIPVVLYLWNSGIEIENMRKVLKTNMVYTWYTRRTLRLVLARYTSQHSVQSCPLSVRSVEMGVVCLAWEYGWQLEVWRCSKDRVNSLAACYTNTPTSLFSEPVRTHCLLFLYAI